jgi:hypothetical protein
MDGLHSMICAHPVDPAQVALRAEGFAPAVSTIRHHDPSLHGTSTPMATSIPSIGPPIRASARSNRLKVKLRLPLSRSLPLC